MKSEKPFELYDNEYMKKLVKSTIIKFRAAEIIAGICAVVLIYGMFKKNMLLTEISFVIAVVFVFFAIVISGKLRQTACEQTTEYCEKKLKEIFGENSEKLKRDEIEEILHEIDFHRNWSHISGDSFKNCVYRGKKFFVVNLSIYNDKAGPEQKDISLIFDGIFICMDTDKRYESQTSIDSSSLKEIANAEAADIYVKKNRAYVFVQTERIFCDLGSQEKDDVEGIRNAYLSSVEYVKTIADNLIDNKDLY